MRKGMKLLAAIVAASVVGSMSISAFGLSYKTETSYADDMVSVKTTVTLDAESEKDDEIAYLVYAGQTADSTTIKYIDQKNAQGASTVTFDWTTNDATINAKAYVGSTDVPETSATEENDNVVKLAAYDVTYSVTGKGIVVLDEDLTGEFDIENISSSGELTDVATAVFHVFPEVGYKFDGVTGQNAVATLSGDGVTVTVAFSDETSINFAFVADETEATLEADNVNGENAVAGKVTKFAKATGAIKEAGIMVAVSDEAKAALAGFATVAPTNAKAVKDADVYMLKAYQIGSDGIYAVSVEDAEKIAEGAAVSAYVIKADDTFVVVE